MFCHNPNYFSFKLNYFFGTSFNYKSYFLFNIQHNLQLQLLFLTLKFIQTQEGGGGGGLGKKLRAEVIWKDS